MNSITEQIKQQISITMMLERYGLDAPRRGAILCPFHKEDTPSLRIYAGGERWKCFGCGRGGSVIDFVMELFHINFRQAVIRLDNDFRLGMTEKKEDGRETSKMRLEAAKRAKEHEEFNQEYNRLWGRYALIDRFLSQHSPSEETGGDYGALMGELDRLWYQIDRMNDQKDRR